MSSSSSEASAEKVEVVPISTTPSAASIARDGLQYIYQTAFFQLADDDAADADNGEGDGGGYTPPPFTGPKRRIQRLHNFPRVGFTNDIASIAMLSGERNGVRIVTSNASASNTNNTIDPILASIEYIPPTQMSGITYNKEDAQDYVKGIAAVAFMILCLYTLWGVSLILLRCGRIDWCFRWRCCKKKKRNSGKKQNEEERVKNNGAGANAEEGQGGEESDDEEVEEDDDDVINQDCCCITCRESIRAKGGCCTRNVFCGWLAGKPIAVPTRSSLMREKEMKDKRLLKMSGVKGVVGRSGINSVNMKKAMDMVIGSSSELKNCGGTTKSVGDAGDERGQEGERGDEHVVCQVASNEEGSAADDGEKERSSNDEGATTKKKSDSTTNKIIITDDYLQKRQRASRRTMLVIRVIFLISAALVIIFSIKLLADGNRGINGIFNSADRSLNFLADYIDDVKTEVDNYIQINEEMAKNKAEWLNRTKSQIESGYFEDKPWCPLALVNDGKIEINISLAKLLLRGTLFKLALIDKADEVKDQAVDALGGVMDTAFDQVGELGNGSIVEGLNDVVNFGGTTRNDFVNNNFVDTFSDTTNTVQTTVDTAVDTAVQTAENVVNTVTGDVAVTACTTVEECMQRSEELGLAFMGNGTFASHGCFSVEGEIAYWGTGTLEEIVSPTLDGDGSTLHERIFCKAATTVAVNAVDNAVNSAVDATKEKVFTVVTFLDALQYPNGEKIQGILGKALGLKNLLGQNDMNGTDSNDDEDKRIKTLIAKLTQFVRSLTDNISDVIFDGDHRQAANAVDAITETIVAKDGINYTILTLADNFTGYNLIINGYNVTKLFTTNLTFVLDVATLTQLINNKLDDSSSILLNIFRRLQTGLETAYQQTRGAQDSLESIMPYFNVAVFFVAFLILLASFFIIGTILAWINKQPRLFRFTQDRILLPIFIFAGLLMWIFTTVFLTLGVLSGDYCVISPDIQMNKILEQTLGQLSPVGYKFAYYYFNACQSAYRPILLKVTYKALIGLRVGLEQFFELMSNLGEGPIRSACGLGGETNVAEGNPVNALSLLADVIRKQIGAAMNTVGAVAKLTLCKSFYPMYSFLVHQVLCTDFINLLGPMFSSMFIISICSMLMVTMRVAWHELVEDEISDADGGKLEEEYGTDVAVETGNNELVEAEKEEEAVVCDDYNVDGGAAGVRAESSGNCGDVAEVEEDEGSVSAPP